MRRALVLVVVAVACGSPPKAKKPAVPSASVAPSASAAPSASVALDPHFREHEPPLAPQAAIPMPHLRDTRLPNGMRLLVASTGGGMFAMRLVFQGPASFPAERPAVARLMVKSLFGGTPSRDAHALRRVLEKRFAAWGTYTTPDAVMIDMTMPDDDVRPCIDVLSDVVQHSNLDTLTIGFELLQLVEQGQTARESPSVVGQHVLARALFGDGHGYARPSTILDGSGNVDRVEVERVSQEILDPQYATIVLAGAVERSVVEHVERSFGSWRMTSHTSATPVTMAAWKAAPRLVVVDRPGSVQSQITFGALAPQRSSPDFYAMELIDQLLGAHRTSRLTSAIVVRDAWSYAGGTHYDAYRSGGSFYWDSSVPADKTAAALQAIDKAFQELGRTPPSQAELDGWKETYVRHLPIAAETARETTHEISVIPVDELPADTLDKIEPSIRAVTPEAVRALAAARLAPDHTRAVVVGDWAKLKPALKALGWGPIEIRDLDGKLLKTEK